MTCAWLGVSCQVPTSSPPCCGWSTRLPLLTPQWVWLCGCACCCHSFWACWSCPQPDLQVRHSRACLHSHCSHFAAVLLGHSCMTCSTCCMLSFAVHSFSVPAVAFLMLSSYSGDVFFFSSLLQASPPRQVLLRWLVVTRPSCWCPWMCPHRRLLCSTWLVSPGGGGEGAVCHLGES